MPIGSGPRTAARGDNNGYPNHPPGDQRQSAFDAVGQGFLAFYEDDEDDDDQPPRHNHTSPGQNQPSSSNHPAHDRRHHQEQRPPFQPPQQHREPPPPQRAVALQREHEPRRPPNGKVPMPIMVHPVPRPPPATFMNSPPPASPQLPPMSPHPLQPPKVPIAPALLVPKNSPRASMVKFAPTSILRGNAEETLLSKTTPKGAEFWRRFSFVVKEESKPEMRRSSWLVKNQSGFTRMKGCIWIITIVILIALGGTGTLVWWLTRDTPALQPKSLGGSANIANEDPTTVAKASTSSSSPLRTVAGMTGPTNTPIPTMGSSTLLPGAGALAKRTANPSPGPTANPLTHRRRRKDRRMVYH